MPSGADAFSPVNASDIIPITGAYRHRTPLPTVAGYEGVGVVIDAPEEAVHLLGKRVLPLRGQGTWQRYVDCPLRMAIPVPDDIHSHLAARAYINPLAAQLMLTHYPSAGKRVLLTAAGSDCAILLGQWARRLGAETVYGIHRSAIHADRLAALGIIPISQMRRPPSGPSPHSQTGFTMPRGASGRRDPECHARRGRFYLLWHPFRPAVPPTARSSEG
jgi:NADPH:quinone reductase-like Zn-dependent oxidoreductase